MSPEAALTLFSSRIFNESNAIYVRGKKYYTLGTIGSGRGSEIFKVTDYDGNFYALKRVHIGMEDSGYLRQSYENEIELLRVLASEDRIIHLIDSEITGSEVLMVLELGDTDLSQIIRADNRAAINLHYIRHTWKQILRAVKAIHEQKIIHGDLKPSNFVLVQGTIKLIDFGIAKMLHDDSTSTNFKPEQLARSSFRYRAPEKLCRVEGAAVPVKVGRAADVWSLGCILYELVYGKSPFPESVNQFREAATNPAYDIAFQRLSNSHDFDCLVDVMERCLERDPHMRPSIEQLLVHQFVQQPDSCFTESKIRMVDNFTELGKQLREDYMERDFDCPLGRKYVNSMAKALVFGRQLKVPDQKS
jgi:serine/threonine-protein kinase TTK/MPS1